MLLRLINCRFINFFIIIKYIRHQFPFSYRAISSNTSILSSDTDACGLLRIVFELMNIRLSFRVTFKPITQHAVRAQLRMQATFNLTFHIIHIFQRSLTTLFSGLAYIRTTITTYQKIFCHEQVSTSDNSNNSFWPTDSRWKRHVSSWTAEHVHVSCQQREAYLTSETHSRDWCPSSSYIDISAPSVAVSICWHYPPTATYHNVISRTYMKSKAGKDHHLLCFSHCSHQL